MAEAKHDYLPDVKKHAANVDEAAVAGIVKHLGIALRNKDSSLVAASDPEELKRVREGFMKKKLARKESDADLDKAIHEMMVRMKGEHDKQRVTVCYLLAEKYGQLALFHPKA